MKNEIRPQSGVKKIHYTYHPSGKVACEDHYDAKNKHRYSLSNTYDEKERLVATTDALGHRTTFAYDIHFNCISQDGPRTDIHKEWSYDKANRPIEAKEWQTDGTILVTEKKYDTCCRLTTQTDPCGFETCYEYNALGQLVAVCYPDGATVCKEYDALGNIIQETDANGYTTHKEYNFRSQPTAIYHPDGREEHFTYSENGGNLDTYTAPNGTKTVYTYDLFDNVIKTETYSPKGKLLKTTSATYSPFNKHSETDSEGVTTTYTYDYAGRKRSEAKDFASTHYTYDDLGRTHTIQTEDLVTRYRYDNNDRILETWLEDVSNKLYRNEKKHYDEVGNLIIQQKAKGNWTTHFNNHHQPIHKIDPFGIETHLFYTYTDQYLQSEVDAHGVTQEKWHDALNREYLTLTKNPSGEEIQKKECYFDPNGNCTQETHTLFEKTKPIDVVINKWEYGPNNRLEKLIESETKITTYTYDENGRLASTTKPNGVTIYREYDFLDHLSRKYSHDFDYHYIYDREDRLLAVENYPYKTTRSYDALGNLTQETLETDLTFISTFDTQSRKTKLTLPNQETIHWSYKGPYLYQVKKDDYIYTYHARDYDGDLTDVLLPNSLGKIHFSLDRRGRLESSHSPFYTSKLAYDDVGNLIQYAFKDPLGQVLEKYTYDDLHQILSDPYHDYTCDSMFNRRSKDDCICTVNTLCQITHDGNQELIYDANGNLLSNGTCQFSYDSQDRLTTVDTEDLHIEYTYDPFHRRLSKTTFKNGETIDQRFYLWDGKNEIGSINSQGEILELRVLGEGLGAEIGAGVLFELNGEKYLPLHDHRGSLATLISVSSKTSIETCRYTPFGEKLTPTSISPWQYANKRLDEETGFYYFGRRYFAPNLGRWITPDPQGFDDGPNLYAYLKNNPLWSVDLYGLYCSPPPRDKSPREESRLADRFNEAATSTVDTGLSYIFPFVYELNQLPSNAPMWQRAALGAGAAIDIFATFCPPGKGAVIATHSFYKVSSRYFRFVPRQGAKLAAKGKMVQSAAKTSRVARGVLNPSAKGAQRLANKVGKSSRVGRQKNWLNPDALAEGAHSVFRRDPMTKSINHYATYRPQTNPYNPNSWEVMKRFDGIGSDPHWNKVLGQDIFAPHIHDSYCPGGIRFALPWEIPR